MQKVNRQQYLWVAVLAIVPLLGWWAYGLSDLDEGFYGAVIREMLRRGDFVTPYYNGHPWFEKPILLYWLSAPMVLLFGDEFGPRMSSVLASLGLYWLIFSQTRRIAGERAGLMAALFCSSSLLVVAVGKSLMTDSIFDVCLAASLLLFYQSCQDRPKLRVMAGLFVGLSVLAKGPVGLLFFGIIVGIAMWRIPGLRAGARGQWIGFWAACLATIALWYAPAYGVNGQLFIDEFIVKQNIQRFRGGDAAHTDTRLFAYFLYFPILIIAVFPWGRWLPSTISKWRKSDLGDFSRYCWIWALTIFGFFTLSSAKLPHYVLPVIPPLAIVAGVCAAQRESERRKPFKKTLIGAGIWAISLLLITVGAMRLAYYGGEIGELKIPGAQAEAHDLIRFCRRQGGDVAAYQLPRRDKSLGTGTLRLQETSLPSLAFYLDQPLVLAETFDQLKAAPRARWLFTRVGRISDADLREWEGQGIRLILPASEPEHRYFVVYEIDRS